MSSSELEKAAHIEVWQQPDGMWRWKYVEGLGSQAQELVSYMAFEKMSGAEESAEESYSGVPVWLPEEVRRSEGKQRRHSGRRFLLLLGVGVAVLVARPLLRRHRES